MTSASDFYAQAITRRRYGQWGLVAAMAGVAGCGGGGGFALQQGAMARLPDELCGPAFNSQGDFQFVSGTYDCRVGRRSRQGASSFSPAPWDFHGLLFDALDRYLVTGGGGTIEYLQGETPVRLAGGAKDTPVSPSGAVAWGFRRPRVAP